MFDIRKILNCLPTINVGLFDVIGRRCTPSGLDLIPAASTMGASEPSAFVGGFFVTADLGAKRLDAPLGPVTIGFAVAGAAPGRMLRAIFDKPPVQKSLVFGAGKTTLAACSLLLDFGGP